MLILCNAESCVHLKENTGGLSSLAVFLLSFLMVVTSHEVCDFCCRSILYFSVFAIYWPLQGDIVDCLCVDYVVFLLGVVFFGMLWFSEEK